jgi:hypothetical protein
LRLDIETLRVMPRIVRAYRGGDDHLLSGIGRILEDWPCWRRPGRLTSDRLP